ncbi:hypothetical protein BFF78_38515 [Streptomyces fodineus]|uniref:Uncharacterized protein n=1 Tax=Streptomyces fodineus TaxID=1904616 RepID=A0A1D7YKP4_9ACTN|nr:hypothetical protein [Streptomyces fodineus]AOR36168.1 hypothetical protein BFF78_38515 [Streptomyces fodineus]
MENGQLSCARGTVDAPHAPELPKALAEHIAQADRAAEHPVPDMTEVHLARAAAVRPVDRATGAVVFAGRALPVVQPRPQVREALRAAGRPVHAATESALNSPEARRRPGPRPGGTGW